MPSFTTLRRFFLIAVLGVFVPVFLTPRYILTRIVLAEKLPLNDPFFPQLLQKTHLFVLAFSAPPLLALSLMLTKRRLVYGVYSVVWILCALLLLCHQTEYGKADGVVNFWLGIWMLWLVTARTQSIQQLAARSSTIYLAIVSMIFFCAALGKLCAAYTEGLLFSDMMGGNTIFRSTVFYSLTALRFLFPNTPPSLLYSGFGYFIIVVELVTGTVVFWSPPRLAYWWLFSVFVAMPLLCRLDLFVLTGNLLSAALANYMLLMSANSLVGGQSAASERGS